MGNLGGAESLDPGDGPSEDESVDIMSPFVGIDGL